MASERPRESNGQFRTSPKKTYEELMKELEVLHLQLSTSKYESQLLRERLNTTERELSRIRNQSGRVPYDDDMYLRQVGMHGQPCGQNMSISDLETQLELEQQGIIYSPFRHGNTLVDAFKEKIDFSQRKHDLRPINSPYLLNSDAEKQQLQHQQAQQQLQQELQQQFAQQQLHHQQLQQLEAEKRWVEQLLENDSSSDDEVLADI